MRLQELKLKLKAQFETLKRNKLAQIRPESEPIQTTGQNPTVEGPTQKYSFEFLVSKSKSGRSPADSGRANLKEFIKIMSSLIVIKLSNTICNSIFIIALEDIGLADTVASASILEIPKVIVNIIAFRYFDIWSRRWLLTRFNLVVSSIGWVFVLISTQVGWTETRLLNLILAFILKTGFALSWMMSDLSAGKGGFGTCRNM